MKRLICGILLLSLIACAKKDQGTSLAAGPGQGAGAGVPGSEFDQSGSEAKHGVDSLGNPPDGPRLVIASPAEGKEIALAIGDEVADLTTSVRAPVVYAVVRGSDGRSRVLGWSIGGSKLDTIATLPDSVRGRAIAQNPARGSLFVAGDTVGGSRIYRFTPDAGRWDEVVIYSTRRTIERLVMSTRPFGGEDGIRYRVFFAARSADGSVSLRTITEGGRIEYQVIGPKQTVDSTEFQDEPPNRLEAPAATPLQVDPSGSDLYWRDAQGCAHRRGYGFENWGDDVPLHGLPCEGELRLTPNGRNYLVWNRGKPGVASYRISGSAPLGTLAANATFLMAPSSVADGRGLVGPVQKGSATSLMYVPVTLPLADVANAWALAGSLCDEALFTRNGGLFRDFAVGEYPQSNQLYAVYERSHYDGGETPALATTDLFLENFGIAFNGVFIVLERKRAMPAFREFVDAANTALARDNSGSTWAKAFAAVAAYYRGETTGEAGLIAAGKGSQHSDVLDSMFNFDELMPRGHYTSDSAMRQYFRAVHYLTQINQVRDPVELATLPAEVQRMAMRWIDGYRPFIAPSRAQLVWTVGEGRTKAPYARHGWKWSAIFPLSWGIDNEALEAAVQHDNWPTDEWIVAPGPQARQHASGLDVAVMFGDRVARDIHGDTLRKYPTLGPILDGIGARRPAQSREASIYQRWLDAVALDWADSTAFPAAPAGSQLWATKRLQSGLASWATIREATILVSERADAAEMGEGGFESLDPEPTRGYVEPAPKTFEAIAGLYDALRDQVQGMEDLGIKPGEESMWDDASLRDGIAARLKESGDEARHFADMARRELRGEVLADSEYQQIQGVGGSAEHMFQIYKSLSNPDLALSVPDPMPKIADVQGDLNKGVLEVAVGAPIEWHQIVPFFGRREVAVGSVYSYYEFISSQLYDNERWRKEVPSRPHPTWVQPYMATSGGSCRAPAAR